MQSPHLIAAYVKQWYSLDNTMFKELDGLAQLKQALMRSDELATDMCLQSLSAQQALHVLCQTVIYDIHMKDSHHIKHLVAIAASQGWDLNNFWRLLSNDGSLAFRWIKSELDLDYDSWPIMSKDGLSRAEFDSISRTGALQALVESHNTTGILEFKRRFEYTREDVLFSVLLVYYGYSKQHEPLLKLFQFAKDLKWNLSLLWQNMVHQTPTLFTWLVTQPELCRHIHLPMMCPNRAWCFDHNADRHDPERAFKTWWHAQNTVWQKAIQAHLAMEWRRRFIEQPKFYYLLDEPSREQTMTVALHPEAVYDQARLDTYYPGWSSVLQMLQELGTPSKLIRFEMRKFFERAYPEIEQYELPD